MPCRLPGQPRGAFLLAALLVCLPCASRAGAEPERIRVLFLGDDGHHRPAERFRQLEPVLRARGIDLTYTDRTSDLNASTLAAYDGLTVYANTTEISPGEEAALLEYVAGGKGFIPLHCASYCFLNSPRYIELVGAQFLRHGTGVFRTTIAEPEHPILRGFRGFESWDETYVHTKHNEKDRIVLEVRDEKGASEPWSWVRTQGKGRVFYTAWGHDERTWSHPGFQSLVERGIRWAVGGNPAVVPSYSDGPEMTPQRKDVKPFEYVEANVPYYPAGKAWGTIGEPIRKMQKPLDPAESQKHYVMPAGFELRLFASEPQIGGKPICMSWDERGRLWVAETFDYPNEMQPEGEGRDRIRICEDTNGDGRADKFTVFAEKLSIPTSLAFSRGGAIVHQMPHTLFLKDRDGDDVADERTVLFTGWSYGDTHAGPSNLHYGLDNWIHGIVGYSGFEGTAGGERLSFRTGFYRFKPDGSKLEFLRNTNNNSWGVGFSEEGVLFGSTANANPSEYLPIPNRYYEAVRGWSSAVLGGIAGNPRFHPITENVRQVDQHDRFTAAAGHALYTARTYPREYWNRIAFVTEATGHLIATFQLQPEGAGFRSRIGWNLLASDDEWAAPIMAEVGPDGNVWVIDWYNFIVQHNPTPAGFKTGKGSAYVTDLRDKKHGRVYRLVYTGAKAEPPMSLAGAPPERLVEALKHTNLLWRKHAQRLLVERGQKDVIPALLELAADGTADEIGLNAGAIHALWTLHGLGTLDGSNAAATATAIAGLKHASAGVRRNAALVLPRTTESAGAIVESSVLKDPDGQVRLAAFLALSEMPPSEAAAEAAASALDDEAVLRDAWLPDAVTSAAAAQDLSFLKAVLARRPEKEPGAKTVEVVERVAEHFARGAPASTAGSLVAMLSSEGSRRVLSAAVIAGLARGWPKDAPVRLDAGAEESLVKLLEGLPPAARGQLASLARRWGSEALKKHAAEIAGSFLSIVRDEKESEKGRVEAARGLVDFSRTDAGAVKQLLEVITARTSSELAGGLVEAAGRSEAGPSGEAILENLASLTPAVRSIALRVLLGRTEWTRSLLEAIERGDVLAGELSLDQKQGLAVHPDRRIAREAKKLLSQTGGLPSPDRQAVLDQLLPLAEKKGDAAAGKAVFQKQCGKCHMHSGEGNKVGPDLTGMAVHPKAELLTQVIDPSRSVEGNFRVYTVVTRDGRVLSGLLASETKTTLEIFDAEGQKSVVLREDVGQLVASSKSLMPEGFEKQVSPDDIVNLLEFLAQRGKYLPVPIAKAATIVSTRGMFFGEESPVERLIFSDWSPKELEGVPFQLVDPQDGRRANAILLHGPQGRIPPRMPKSVTLPCNSAAKAVHFLSGVSGWGFPASRKGSVTMIVRFHYDDGKTEDHELVNGEHFADYIRRVDVPKSKFAYALRGQQIRYLTVIPERRQTIRAIELVKGPDETAPVVMAVTVETM